MSFASWYVRLPRVVLAVALLQPAGELSAQEPLAAADLAHKVDSLAAVILESGPVAALSIGVKRGDEVLLAEGYGLADIENGVPAGAETVYRIGSVTKQFTAAGIMKLVEEGRIGLDDPITKYFPDYPTQDHDVRVHHLLTHTSGIKSYTSLENWRSTITVDLSDDELVRLFKDEPFDFAPGERFLYNNSGYYLLGMLIGEVTGTPYAQWVERALFEPQGLDDTTYCDERRIIERRAEGYEIDDGALVNDEYLSMNQPGAAGALCSTVPDLLEWADALASGQVVSADSYARMITPATLTDSSSTGYGFGLGVGTLEGRARIQHGGGINGFVSLLAHYPDDDVTVVVLSNTEGPQVGRVADMVSRWALGLEVAAVVDLPLDADELARYVGTYELRPGFELTVSLRDGQLWGQATGQGSNRLRAQGDHVFVPTFDDRVRVVFTVEGERATSLTLYQGGAVVEAPRIR